MGSSKQLQVRRILVAIYNYLAGGLPRLIQSGMSFNLTEQLVSFVISSPLPCLCCTLCSPQPYPSWDFLA